MATSMLEPRMIISEQKDFRVSQDIIVPSPSPLLCSKVRQTPEISPTLKVWACTSAQADTRIKRKT